MDFEEPKKVEDASSPASNVPTTETKENANSDAAGPGEPPMGELRVQVDEITREDRERLQLEDAGEGAQPLRLLACGHVFHVSIAR